MTSIVKSLSSDENVYSFDPETYSTLIEPFLLTFLDKNKNLRERVECILSNSSDSYITKQNVQIFTNLCIDLGIQAEDLTSFNFEKFRKATIMWFNKREDFNIIDTVVACFTPNIKSVNYTNDNAWKADTDGARGHNRIGEGEIFFSFFSGGIKPKTGDVEIEQYTPLRIEFKGTRGRLLATSKISIDDSFKSQFLRSEQTARTLSITLCVLSGIITSREGEKLLVDASTVNDTYNIYSSDIISTITATNALEQYDFLKKGLMSRWPNGATKMAMKALCGGIQIVLYKKKFDFNYMVLTNADKPYMCKGFSASDSILANTLTFLNNKISIQQNLDGKGFHISFEL